MAQFSGEMKIVSLRLRDKRKRGHEGAKSWRVETALRADALTCPVEQQLPEGPTGDPGQRNHQHTECQATSGESCCYALQVPRARPLGGGG